MEDEAKDMCALQNAPPAGCGGALLMKDERPARRLPKMGSLGQPIFTSDAPISIVIKTPVLHVSM